MESKLERESKMKALNALFCNEMPEILNKDGDKIWALGLAKVYRGNCSHSYVIVANDGENNPSLVRDFGDNSIIVKFEEIYPVYYLDNDTMPLLTKQSDFVTYLSTRGYKADEIRELLSEELENGKKKTKKQLEEDKAFVMKAVISIASMELYNQITA